MNTAPQASRILLNATQVGQDVLPKIHEFLLDEKLSVVECVYVHSPIENLASPVLNYQEHLKNILFSLNHVRVNPELDNYHVTRALTKALSETGVCIENAPHQDMLSICFKPLGEIREEVRFYLNEQGEAVFLAPKNVKLRLVKPHVGGNPTQTP